MKTQRSITAWLVGLFFSPALFLFLPRYIYTYTHVPTHIDTLACTHSHIHTHINTHTQTQTQSLKHTQTYIFICAYKYTHTKLFTKNDITKLMPI